jgi:predicted alpha/beta superfamily hydrolase
MRRLLLILLILLSVTAFPQDNKFNTGDILTINSVKLGEARKIFVSLPLSYATGRESYPVLYLLDGETHFQYAGGMMRYLGGAGSLPEMIVVAIPNTKRNRDFTPTAMPGQPNSGGAANFLSFLEDELIPMINKNYRTAPYKILFGHSLTGMFTIYTMLNKPGLFNAYIAASPYVQYDNDNIVKQADLLLKSRYDIPQHLYITIGNEPDYFPPLEKLTGIFKSKAPEGFNFEYTKMPGENHTTIPVKTINDCISKIFEGWALPDDFPQKGNAEMLKEHFKMFNKNKGISLTPSEIRINLAGYQCMQAGRINEALDIFAYNIELYPTSANVYDSYGEGLEAAGKFGMAEKNYSKAVEVGTPANDPNLPVYKQHLEAVKGKK